MHGAALMAARQAIDLLLTLLRSGSVGPVTDIGLQLVTFGAEVKAQGDFAPPHRFQRGLPAAGGLTPLAAALRLIDDDVTRRSAPEGERPLVCVLTDGDLTDLDGNDSGTAAEGLRLLFITCGLESNRAALTPFSGAVVSGSDLNEDTLRRFLNA